VPGGEGAQELPSYLALRGEGTWTSFGQLPPASYGERALVLGWLPGFSKTFLSATRLGNPGVVALLERPGDGAPPTQITPYVAMTGNQGFSYVGASQDGSKAAFEAPVKLPPEEGAEPIAAAHDGASNVYVYDEEDGRMSLASVLNTPAETEAALSKGAFAGSYDWIQGVSDLSLSRGGAARNYYTQDERVVSSDGSVFFTAAGTGQLYMRLNPTESQSALDGEDNCTEPEKACTVHVSASKRTPPDPAGSRPAAFHLASADGSLAFFTSPEELTDDANTGPPQHVPAIGRVGIDGESAMKPDFLKGHRAVGVAVDSKYVYWADPVDGTIGRAELDGGNPEDTFITPGPTEVESEPGVFEAVASKPRYVAVDSGHVYWTNTADGKVGHGTVGRADIEGTPASVEPDFIEGASSPQGIAVNATHIYWANSSGSERTIGRAALGGEDVEMDFITGLGEFSPYGIALSPTYVYYTLSKETANFISRRPLEGGKEDFQFVSPESILRGVAVEGSHVYWAAQGEEAIGRAEWPDAEPKPTAVDKEFTEVEGALNGLAVDSEHIYWSIGGEATPSPGNDLYRFDRGTGTLSDLTPDSLDVNGAEVQGVLGASADGSRVYFVANADLDGTGPAEAGDCHGIHAPGSCNLYLWQKGHSDFIARLNARDANWAPTTTGIFSGSDFQKTSFVSPGGETLLFSSAGKLTSYDNEGLSMLYRYRIGESFACMSCNPTGESSQPASLGMIKPSVLRVTEPASLASRNLSADGNRAFFETTAALVGADTDGEAGCPPLGHTLQRFPSCLDVYEWEAPGTGTCTQGGPAYSPLNGGCLYLLSSGDDDYPSFFADASASGSDVFLFTRSKLVGQDQDELLDLYDARVGGGLASQNQPPPPPPCEAEGCKPAPGQAPSAQSPGSGSFQGPGNPKAQRKASRCAKASKRKGKRRCAKSKRHKNTSRKRASSKQGGSR
jgi:hypothetical protein